MIYSVCKTLIKNTVTLRNKQQQQNEVVSLKQDNKAELLYVLYGSLTFVALGHKLANDLRDVRA